MIKFEYRADLLVDGMPHDLAGIVYAKTAREGLLKVEQDPRKKVRAIWPAFYPPA